MTNGNKRPSGAVQIHSEIPRTALSPCGVHAKDKGRIRSRRGHGLACPRRWRGGWQGSRSLLGIPHHGFSSLPQPGCQRGANALHGLGNRCFARRGVSHSTGFLRWRVLRTRQEAGVGMGNRSRENYRKAIGNDGMPRLLSITAQGW